MSSCSENSFPKPGSLLSGGPCTLHSPRQWLSGDITRGQSGQCNHHTLATRLGPLSNPSPLIYLVPCSKAAPNVPVLNNNCFIYDCMGKQFGVDSNLLILLGVKFDDVSSGSAGWPDFRSDVSVLGTLVLLPITSRQAGICFLHGLRVPTTNKRAQTHL